MTAAASEYHDFSERAKFAINELKQNKDFKDYSFEIDFNTVPSPEEPLIMLNGSVFLTVGQISCLIAGAGTGKSNLVEALGANAMNEDCDAFGFRVNVADGKEVLIIDTERIRNDLYRGLLRIKKRAKTYLQSHAYEQLTEDGRRYKKLEIRGFREIPTSEQRWATFEHYVSSGKYSLVIIDGIADFLKSMNSEQEAVEIVDRLIALANKYKFGILTTIHPRPGDPNFKPNGHCGSQIWKKAESAFVAYKADEGTRIITTDFLYGKVRNGKDQITSVFKWDDEEGMMVTFKNGDEHANAIQKFKTTKDLHVLVEKVFDENDVYYEDDLVKILKSRYKKPEKITKKTLSYLVEELGWLEYEAPPIGFGHKGHYKKKNSDKLDRLGEQDILPF